VVATPEVHASLAAAARRPPPRRPPPRTAVRPVAVRALAVMVVLGLLSACTGRTAQTSNPPRTPSGSPRTTSPSPDPTDFDHGPAGGSWRGDGLVSVTTIVRNLDIPWGVTFLPDGSALVTERQTLQILKVGPQRQPGGDLTVAPLATIREASSDNEGGLLGIAASPNFSRDRTVFIYYTTTVDNRIAKLRLGEGPKPIVTGVPRAGIHDGGRLAFGPDGYLYASTGDASGTDNPQDLGNLGGKILRMTVDGKPAPGNPFPGSLVWSYGHRNPEGMAWDHDGIMFVAEIGQAVWDELNVIQPGRNYGWPKVEGISNDPAYVDPVVAWRPEVGVSAGVAILGKTAVVTCLRGQRIYLVSLNGTIASGFTSRRVESGAGDPPGIRWRPDAGVAGHPLEALTTKYGRLRTAINAPDGSIWLTTSNRDGRNPGGPSLDDDRILRLTMRGR
jgi:glucose/arabinose dehydrogenase